MWEGGSLGIRDSTIFAEPDEELTWMACRGMCMDCFKSANKGNKIKNMKHLETFSCWLRSSVFLTTRCSADWRFIYLFITDVAAQTDLMGTF